VTLSFRAADSEHPWLLMREYDDWGLTAYDLLRPPDRFWSDGGVMPPAMRTGVDARRVQPEPLPTELLRALPEGDGWSAMSRRSLHRLFAWFLIAEDPQHRLDVQPVATLAHQVSLVQHILQEPNLQSVLLADEVGLGKTIEAGLIVKHLLRQQPALRVLYLAPARLVSNVRREMERLGLRFRSWVAGPARDAQLDDPLIVASIHRAVVPTNFDEFVSRVRWDVVIVDECHHLTAYGPEGGSAVRKYRLVERLRKSLRPSSRLILLSGTPHQGNAERFENVLRLLCRDGEPLSSVAGRVIYRTKEDVRDWNGRPLFPVRSVNPPIVLDLGEAHRRWLRGIHELFEPHLGPGDGAERRAAGWRCGQALQWATSSIEAGLGYLVRQAMRAGWTPRREILAEALAVLRPYRNGPRDEPVQALFDRISRELALQASSGVVEDMEELDDLEERWSPDEEMLERVLRDGIALLGTDRTTKWRALDPVLHAAGREKVVFFAQPIETVMALARYLEQTSGRAPALIIGNQTEQERTAEVNAFWAPDGPQHLVSSRAGGEGLNLQVARRLVHVDVPWNPMEMEQRVGRVHRFMSRRTIIVDTLVVQDSREAEMYEVARAKMREVASSLAVDDGRFEALFSRVMALVPPEELQNVLVEDAMGPLTGAQRNAVATLVAAGFKSWEAFHHRYAQQQQQLRALSPGEATWEDVERFAIELLGAAPIEGHRAMRFEQRDGEVVEASIGARGLRIGDVAFGVGDHGGMPILDEAGRSVRRLGVNVPELQEGLRRFAFPREPAGAAHIRWPADEPCPVHADRPFGVLAIVRRPIRMLDSGAQELEPELRVWAGTASPLEELTGDRKGALIRGLLRGVIRREPEVTPELLADLEQQLAVLSRELRAPSDSERTHQIRAAVFPLLAAIVS
jgi:superfamily II DNA or RNA helicase